MTRARDQIISLDDTPYYHCMARCVRRAYLFGEDSVTGRSFNHRKAWVVDKLGFLSDVFSIDVCAYAVMSNHYHVVFRVDAQAAESWSEREVIDRWTSLFAGNVLVGRYLAGEATSKAEQAKVSEFVETWRARLIDISWFMRVLNESIARQANQEDNCKGRFWEGRFKSQALLDEAAVLACMAYVDLNPVRAGIEELPEDSDFTSIQARLDEFSNRKAGRPTLGNRSTHNKSIKRAGSTNSTESHKPKLYPFNAGFELNDDEKTIHFSLQDYLELIDWTGRAIRDDKRGAIPEKAPPILHRIGFSESKWLEFVPRVEKSFTHAIGGRESLAAYAARNDLSWVRGVGVDGPNCPNRAIHSKS